jgi:hypothetical protein
MGGLWSLPAGGAEPGESDQEALVREFAEETGLEVAVDAKVATVQRPSWYVNTYQVHILDGSLNLAADTDIADLRWFAFDELPEEMVLEARIAILRYQLASTEEPDAGFLANAINALFSALFYSYLRSCPARPESPAYQNSLSWADARRNREELIISVRRFLLGEPRLAVLIGWLELSLRDGQPCAGVPGDFKYHTQNFIDDFDDICRGIP